MSTTTTFSPANSQVGPALGKALPAEKQPGHWLLASLGKRVLRPGGIELTRKLLANLAPTSSDRIVEFAPGLGATARRLLAQSPASYTGIERDEAAVNRLRSEIYGHHISFYQASAEQSGLPEASATVLCGEAMLTMQTLEQKQRILAEAYRLLAPGGRYGIHELALIPDDIPPSTRREIERAMSQNIHVGVRPATFAEWKSLLQQAGFLVRWEARAPMHLLEPRRVLADEGIGGVLRIAQNLLRNPSARARVIGMRRLFRRYADHLCAVALVCEKPR